MGGERRGDTSFWALGLTVLLVSTAAYQQYGNITATRWQVKKKLKKKQAEHAGANLFTDYRNTSKVPTAQLFQFYINCQNV